MNLTGCLSPRKAGTGTSGVSDVVFNYNYDAVNNLTTVRDSIDGIAKGIESFQYDALNRVTRITQSGNGVSDKRFVSEDTIGFAGGDANLYRYGETGEIIKYQTFKPQSNPKNPNP